MKNKKLAVIFDTNSYRKLVHKKELEEALQDLKEISDLEQKKSIQAYGSVIVGMEMLGNLAEGEEGFNYKDCLNGVVLMSKHCNDKERNQTRILPHVQLLVEHTMFGHIKSKSIEKNVQNLGGTIMDFRDDAKKAITHHNAEKTFESIKNYLDRKEEDFCNQIEDLIDGAKNQVLNEYPNIDKKGLRKKTLELLNSQAFLNMMSMAVIQAIYNNVGEEINGDELSNRAEFMRDSFPLAAGFYQWIAIEVFSKDIDLHSKNSIQKRWNWLWDYHVSYVISNSTINGREAILVTSDVDLTEIIKANGFDVRVMTLEEYQDYLTD